MVRGPVGGNGDTTNGRVTSGGQYHDACGPGECEPVAFWDCVNQQLTHNDWAMDVDIPTGANPTKLSLDYNGFNSDQYITTGVDDDYDVTIEAKVECEGNIAAGAPSDCQYQQIAILATWRGINGTWYTDRVVGRLWFLHVNDWVYDPGDVIATNEERDNPDGTGTVHYILAKNIANYAPAVANCGQGSHIHIEFYSTHSWGKVYEWHADDGMFSYPDYGDGYIAWSGSEHTHYSSTNYPNGEGSEIADLVVNPNAGKRILGMVGGGKKGFFMQSNPYYTNH